MAESRFAPHGQFRVSWCGDVLCSELVGAFNVQAMRAYVAELKAQGAARSTRWGRLADMRQWEGMTPEAGKLFEEFAQWIKTTECKVSVQLLSESFQKTIAAHVAQRLQTNHLYQCTDSNQALRILQDYALDVSDLAQRLAPPQPPRM